MLCGFFIFFSLRILPNLRNFTNAVQSEADRYLVEYDPWHPGFETYLKDYYLERNQEIDDISSEFFHEKLTQYLYSPSGGRYRHLFKFENDTLLECGQSAPKVLVRNHSNLQFSMFEKCKFFVLFLQMSSIMFQHKQFYSTNEQIEAMEWLKELIAQQNFPGKAFASAQPYSRWEIDQVIGWELHRNLIIAIVCVFVTTFLLIANFTSCLLVLITVLLNLVILSLIF